MKARVSSLAGLLAVLLALAGSGLPRAQEAPAPPAAGAPPPSADTPPAPAPAEPSKPAEAAIPAAFPLGRYEESWRKNPFMLKTAPVAVVKVSFAEDWALASISKRDGMAVVRMQNKKTGERRMVKETPEKDDEFRLIKANVSRNYKESTAEIAKGDEVATIKHDETLAAARAPVPGAPRAGQPGMSGAPGMGVPLPGQAGQPRGMTTMTPGTTGRPGGYAPPGPPQQQQQLQNTFQRPGMAAPPGATAAVQQPTAPVMNIPVPGGGTFSGGTGGQGTSGGNVPAQGTPAPVVRRRALIPGPNPAPTQ